MRRRRTETCGWSRSGLSAWVSSLKFPRKSCGCVANGFRLAQCVSNDSGTFSEESVRFEQCFYMIASVLSRFVRLECCTTKRRVEDNVGEREAYVGIFSKSQDLQGSLVAFLFFHYFMLT